MKAVWCYLEWASDDRKWPNPSPLSKWRSFLVPISVSLCTIRENVITRPLTNPLRSVTWMADECAHWSEDKLFSSCNSATALCPCGTLQFFNLTFKGAVWKIQPFFSILKLTLSAWWEDLNIVMLCPKCISIYLAAAAPSVLPLPHTQPLVSPLPLLLPFAERADSVKSSSWASVKHLPKAA